MKLLLCVTVCILASFVKGDDQFSDGTLVSCSAFFAAKCFVQD